MTQDHTISTAEIEVLTSGARFDIRPLMAAYMTCTMAMMAFVSLIGPIARSLHLALWQAGAVVTVGGVLWTLLSRPWGTLSDRRGRRAMLLMGVSGFLLAYWAMCALLIVSSQVMTMNTTTRISTAERLGRTFGRRWRAYARGERRVSNWLISKGMPQVGAAVLLCLLAGGFCSSLVLLRHGWRVIRPAMMTAGRNRMNCAMARRASVCIHPAASGSTLMIRTILST